MRILLRAAQRWRMPMARHIVDRRGQAPACAVAALFAPWRAYRRPPDQPRTDDRTNDESGGRADERASKRSSGRASEPAIEASKRAIEQTKGRTNERLNGRTIDPPAAPARPTSYHIRAGHCPPGAGANATILFMVAWVDEQVGWWMGGPVDGTVGGWHWAGAAVTRCMTFRGYVVCDASGAQLENSAVRSLRLARCRGIE